MKRSGPFVGRRRAGIGPCPALASERVGEVIVLTVASSPPLLPSGRPGCGRILRSLLACVRSTAGFLSLPAPQ
eukprot:541800-Alexandrium_andersonii.AAC.1